MTALAGITVTAEDVALVAFAVMCLLGMAGLLFLIWSCCAIAKDADARTAEAWREVAEKRQV